MKVLLAGATGALGRPLTQALIDAGHQVVGLTRTSTGIDQLRASGAEPVQADVLDRDGLLRALTGHHVDAVIHELTSLRKMPLRYRDMSATNVLRTTGSTHLLEAARRVGATRFVTQSIVFGYGYRDLGVEPLTERAPFGHPQGDAFDPSLSAMASAEQQAFTTPGIEGIALRYGLFYGGDLPTVVGQLRKRALPVIRGGGKLAFVHHEDAAAATVAALHHGRPGEAYNVVDDQPATFSELITGVAQTFGTPPPLVLPAGLVRFFAPYGGAILSRVSMRVSNDKARNELGWRPRFACFRDGLAEASALVDPPPSTDRWRRSAG
jgi:nucleoside-diphosphate-sugar epimerase